MHALLSSLWTVSWIKGFDEAAMAQTLQLDVLVADEHASCGVTKLQLWLKSLDVKPGICFAPHHQRVGQALS